MTAIDAIGSYHDELTAIRRDIHVHPEIGFEEQRTAELVAQKLAEWGIEVHREVGGTGVVGVLRRGNGQAAIGLRADMDALPMEEDTELAYAAARPGGCMPAAMTGTPRCCWGRRGISPAQGEFNGTVNFIFQPAEEGLGGARAMIKDGCSSGFRATSSTGCTTGRAWRWASSPFGPA